VIEVQKHLIENGDRVVLIDDVLATGGTLNAAISLAEKLGAKVVGILLLSKVKALNGIDKLKI
jgi:adenine phosphoribosyltransferase